MFSADFRKQKVGARPVNLMVAAGQGKGFVQGSLRDG
jgi:hypothetical protein